MADYLFVSQQMLDNWMTQGKIDFSGHVMTIRGDRRSYVLEPAVRFVKVVGDEPDGPGLIGKVKTLDQVAAAGGEHYHDSVIVEDVAFEVQNGFLARVSLPEATEPPPEARAEGVEEAPPPAETAEVETPPSLESASPTPVPAEASSRAPAEAPSRAPAEASSRALAEASAAAEHPPVSPASPEGTRPDESAPAVDATTHSEADEDETQLLTDFLLKNLR